MSARYRSLVVICGVSLGLQPLLGTEGGYASLASVEQGQAIDFHISTKSPELTLEFYREGVESELMLTVSGLPAREHSCPEPGYETGCGWPVSYTLAVPHDWRSGHYTVLFSTGTKGTSRKYLLFTVCEDQTGSTSNIFMTIPTNTYHAYSAYAGKSLYPASSSDEKAARKVSYDRPYTWMTPRFGKYFRFAHPFVRWAESHGYTIEYGTSIDLHRDSQLLHHYSVYVTVGHDEYWSREMRDHFEAFIRAGGQAMILSGNTCWWQVRFSADMRTMIGYKSKARTQDPVILDGDSSNDHLTTTTWWRDPVNDIESRTLGLSFKFGGYHNRKGKFAYEDGFGGYRVYRTGHWLFEGTGLSDGDMIGRESTIVGDEVDGTLVEARDAQGNVAWDGRGHYPKAGALPYVVDTATSGTPDNFVILGLAPATTGHGVMGLFTLGDGVVFNAGTIEWSHGLDSDSHVQRITANLLDRFAGSAPPPVPDNELPTASILAVGPTPAAQGTRVDFVGEGVDDDGHIVAYRWRSSLDGTLSQSASFHDDSLSVGEHTAFFRVKDNAGAWSPEVTATVRVTPVAQGEEIILDNGDAGTVAIGGWKVSGSSKPYGDLSLFASRFEAGATYEYCFVLADSGLYEVFAWWTAGSKRETEVPAVIEHAMGTDTVPVDQTTKGGQWNSLGQFQFDDTAKITVHSLGRGGTTCADAMRLVRIETGEARPTARIVRIEPNPADAGMVVEFEGSGDTESGIRSYEWKSDRDGDLSEDASFNMDSLSVGLHTITLRIEDEEGVWSSHASESLQIYPVPNELPEVVTLSISPPEVEECEPVVFFGEGTDPDGTIAGYRWTSDLDSLLSLDQTFTSTELTAGLHTITLEVQDNNGDWSAPASDQLVVTALPNTPPRILSASAVPDAIEEGQVVVFTVEAVDDENHELTYEWVSDRDGLLSSERSFPWSTLTAGDHQIEVRAKDELDLWSDPVAVVVQVTAPPNSPPIARIVSLSSSQAEAGVEIVATGEGEDEDGNVVEFEWSSDLEPEVLAAAAELRITTLREGAHTLSFRVRDNRGAWSAATTIEVEILPPSGPVEVVLDQGDEGISCQGFWNVSRAPNPYGGTSLFAGKTAGSNMYTYTRLLPAGTYEVALWWTSGPKRAAAAEVRVLHAAGTTVKTVNQQEKGGQWNELGVYRVDDELRVTIHAYGQGFTTCADAVRFRRLAVEP